MTVRGMNDAEADDRIGPACMTNHSYLQYGDVVSFKLMCLIWHRFMLNAILEINDTF